MAFLGMSGVGCRCLFLVAIFLLVFLGQRTASPVSIRLAFNFCRHRIVLSGLSTQFYSVSYLHVFVCSCCVDDDDVEVAGTYVALTGD